MGHQNQQRLTPKIREAAAKAVKRHRRQQRRWKATEQTALKEVTDKATAEAESLKFEMETKWQGYQGLFQYIENNPELVAWLDREFRATLVSDSVATEQSGGDSDGGMFE